MKYLNCDGVEPTILKAIVAAQTKYRDGVSEYLTDKNADFNISVTTLAKPVQAHFLTIRHWDEIEIDIRDCYPSLMGGIFHAIAEDNAMPGDVVEKRYGKTFKVPVDGVTHRVHVHGACDRYNLEQGYMKDYKFTSMMAMNFDKSDYEQQLNILRFLLPPEEKHRIRTLSNIFVFRDYRASEAKEGRSPQPMFCKELTHPIWDDEQTKDILRIRLVSFIRSMHLPDDRLPECTKEELWYSRSGFRIRFKTKQGEWGKRSSGWAESEEEAHSLSAKKPNTEYRLEPTTGKPRRCGFCNAAAFCKQRKAMLGQSTEDDEQEETIEL